MKDLSTKKTIDLIIRESEKLDIKSYEFGKNAEISTVSAHNILSRSNKNPRKKTLTIMLEYIESKKVGTDVTSENVVQRMFKEDAAAYEKESSIEDIIAQKISSKLEPLINGNAKKIDNLSATMANFIFKLNEMEEKLKTKVNNH